MRIEEELAVRQRGEPVAGLHRRVLRKDPRRLRQSQPRGSTDHHIGYDKAAIIAKTAHHEGKSLREVAQQLGYVCAADFDRYVVALDMTHP
ncbi:hypothetical protein ACK2SD_11855 [Pseudomonas sp. SC11]|uniref:hypothetical protein n=1 Tax=Pseudomonas sp. SC11 TaxID=326927 RepID=UPI00399A3627